MLSQEEVEEWWEWKWKEEWERQLWEHGYAVLEWEKRRHYADDRVLFLCEYRWSPGPNKSTLWDTPNNAFTLGWTPDKKKRRYVRLHMPEQLAQWKARQRRHLAETASQTAPDGQDGPLTREEG